MLLIHNFIRSHCTTPSPPTAVRSIATLHSYQRTFQLYKTLFIDFHKEEERHSFSQYIKILQ